MSEILNYCPECRTEYRDGFTICADCSVPLVRRLDSETVESLVALTRESSFEFVGELLDRLEQGGVPYVIEAGTALDLLDREVPGKMTPQPWEARIWVALSAEGEARRLLNELADRWERERGQEALNRHLHRSGWEHGA